MIDPTEFPEEVQAALAPHLDGGDSDRLATISQAIVERRTEAVSARQEMEGIWTEAEEAYIGIDEMNRHEFGSQRWSKPQSSDGPVTTNISPSRKNTKATAFVRLTARYVDAGAGKLIEILLPPDDRPFSFKEMPVPEHINAKEDNSHVMHDGLGNTPLFRPLKPGEDPPNQTAPGQGAAAAPAAAPGPAPAPAPANGAVPAAGAGQPATPPPGQVPLTVKDLAEEAIELARKKAKQAEDRVYNWLVECGYSAEARKMIFDAARIGTGVIKGPIPSLNRGMKLETDEANGTVELIIREKVSPASKWVDPWNLYPDPACGENIQDGDYIFEKDWLSARQVIKLKDEPGYIASEIDKVLEEGPEKINIEGQGGESAKPGASKKRKRFPVWYFHGTLKREEYLALRGQATRPQGSTSKPEDGLKEDQARVYCICTMINDRVVRAVQNPLSSGDFPYHAFPWQRRTGSWAGIGVAEQMRVPQRMVNASTRAMLNNAGKSAGAQIVLDRSCITPANGSWTVEPDKIWFKNSDSAAMGDVRQAFTMFNIPNVTAQMMEIIQYAMQLAEESTSIPLITQGQTGQTTPDTFGAAQLQNSNANQLLRTIGYTFDDYVTEPHVKQYYQYYLLDPEIPDDEKGEFQVDAHGSVTLVERAIADQAIQQMGPLVINPAYGFDPKKWAKQMVKTKRLDPADFQYTPEEQAKIDANPPPKPPAVAAAEIRAASAEKIAAGDQNIEGKKVENEHEQANAQAVIDLHALQNDMEGLKAELAKVTMTLKMQEKLNTQDLAADLHKHHNPGAGGGNNPPPTGKPKKPNPNPARPLAQTPGRAGNGRAFEQAK